MSASARRRLVGAPGFVASAAAWRRRHLAQLARGESIYKPENFSDHAPITVEYEMTL